MWAPSSNNPAGTVTSRLVAVAIDKDKGSQTALRWAVDNLLTKGQTVILLHVRVKQPDAAQPIAASGQVPDASSIIASDPQLRDLFLPFRVFCTRKDIHCHDIVQDDTDVARAIAEFTRKIGVDIVVLGAGAKSGLFRFKVKDIPGTVLKSVPDFCTVYVIHKGKMASTRAATRSVPSFISPLRSQILSQANNSSSGSETPMPPTTNTRIAPVPVSRPVPETPLAMRQNEAYTIKSPFAHRKAPNGKSYELSEPETDISFVSSRRSVDIFPTFNESFDGGLTPPRLSGFSDVDYQGMDSMLQGRRSLDIGRRSMDILCPLEFSSSLENDPTLSGQSMEDVEAEMRRLKMELKQTMDMYSTACKEALSAREKAQELQRWKLEEQKRLERAQIAEDSEVFLSEQEKAKPMASMEAAQRIADLETKRRIHSEMSALHVAKGNGSPISQPCRYRRYSIEEIEAATEYFAKSRKIGEGGYGPVYKCYLDHTPCAVKVLRPDATQGRTQFQHEVEILSCIRHPNMVLLLGACPEYGCLVYEYMSNGSLEDRLFQRGNTPPLSWQHRFRIAAEISTGLLFLHQNKPEPLVHRDLKPANILLDRNYVSKIGDVGLARLVPSSVADTVTQYRMTSTAGTFCYIDPEYQQTGMLGVKSDIYSLGIIFLQILTAKPPMGLSHHVERALKEGTLQKMLDPCVPDWPVEEALGLTKLALKCAELRRKDRPDLGKVVLPYLDKLRELADDSTYYSFQASPNPSPSHTELSVSKEDSSYPTSAQSSMGS